MPTAHHFLLFGAALLALPAIADLWAKSTNPASSLGLSILLYLPFPFAYAVVAIAGFSALGWREAKERGNNVKVGVIAGAAIGAAWFFVAFLVIAQLHIFLGGRL